MRSIITAVLLLFYSDGIAQSEKRIITGTVSSFEDGVPLENAAVKIKGSNRLSGTQPDGIYYISITPGDSVLVFQAADFQDQEVKITQASEYNVQLHRKPMISLVSTSPGDKINQSKERKIISY